MEYSTIKDLIEMTDRESVQAFIDCDNYPDTNYRIFTEEDAREEVYNMYRDDYYMLGCFNASFREDYICLDRETIETLQASEAYEGIGKAIMNSGNFKDMMDEYISLDGYGNALSSYDGDYQEYEDLIIVRIN